jgi:CMP-N,N'-diacetyllegionaminic acid synthase
MSPGERGPSTRSALAIIPARGGSKGIPNKNLVPLAGKPLISHTIATALASRSIGRTIVSTDSDAIAAVAVSSGADVPFRRPAQLASDTATTESVVLHALAELERTATLPEIIVVLQPTSPLRHAEDVDGAVGLLLTTGASSVVTVCEIEHPLEWTFRRTAAGRLMPLVPTKQVARRQDAKPSFRLNGAVFVVRRDLLRRSGRLRNSHTLGYVMPQERSIDIDTEVDLVTAEALLARH